MSKDLVTDLSTGLPLPELRKYRLVAYIEVSVKHHIIMQVVETQYFLYN